LISQALGGPLDDLISNERIAAGTAVKFDTLVFYIQIYPSAAGNIYLVGFIKQLFKRLHFMGHAVTFVTFEDLTVILFCACHEGKLIPKDSSRYGEDKLVLPGGLRKIDLHVCGCQCTINTERDMSQVTVVLRKPFHFVVAIWEFLFLCQEKSREVIFFECYLLLLGEVFDTKQDVKRIT